MTQESGSSIDTDHRAVPHCILVFCYEYATSLGNGACLPALSLATIMDGSKRGGVREEWFARPFLAHTDLLKDKQFCRNQAMYGHRQQRGDMSGGNPAFSESQRNILLNPG